MEFNRAYNRNELVKFLRTSFLPEDFIQEETPLANPKQFQYTQQVTRLGECKSLELVVFEVMHSSVSDARVGLTKEAFCMLADEFCERALVFFVPQDDNSNYRFSLIEITLEQEEGSAKVKRTFSNPHRYSYYLGEGISQHTPKKYLNETGPVVSIEDLRSRFSVEVLTKAFYQELSDWYAWAVKIVRFPNDLKTEADNEKYNSEAMIRLITRLIFVWFIKQRHLVPDEFFDEKYISDHLLKSFTPNAKTTLFGKADNSYYYKGILQNLFFAMLNSPITPEGKDTISERRFRKDRADYDNNKLMRHKELFKDPDLFVELANKYVPFLNGGLFDCLDDKDNGKYFDAFTDREEIAKQLIVPDYLFFGEDVGRNIDLSEWYGDKKKKKVSARGIIDILKRYNFTVEENTPFDQDVSLDPELLGKVFENLLASYNPETQTTARKQTGSFYTPREIVQYMVDESLVAHLKRTVGDDLEVEYRKLIQYTDEEPNLTDEQRKAILQSIYQCKVLDPACGSGAFPMGMLQQMVHILNRIDPDNKEWKDMMVKNAISETSEAYRNATDEERKEMVADIERSFNENVNRPDYARKLYLIENCIYGVDIQPIAIQISKLRFFISLVVDQKTNDNPVDNFGIRPLPNLEAKFVAANTLIGLEKKDANLFDSEAIKQKEKELKEAKHRIFGAKTVRTKRKYKERVATLRTEIAKMLEDSGFIANEEAQQLASWDMFDQNTSSSFFDPEWMFGIDCGFNIVIGNPPYVLISKALFKTTYERFFRYQEGKIDLYRLFIEKGTYLCSKQGCLSYITPNTFLSIKNCAALRHFLIDSNNIVFIDNYDESVFDASVNSIVFLMLRNSMSTTIDIHLHSSICVESSKLDINKIKTNPLYEININADDVAFRIKDKILKNASLLKDIKGVEICLGAQPYHNTIHTAEEMKSKFLHSDFKVNNNYVRDYGGKHFSKYIVDKTPSKWIDYSAEFYTKPDERFFTGSRIVIREIPYTTLICAYLETFALFNKSVFIIRCSYPSVNLKYILAVLNSKAVGYYISAFGDKSKQTLFPRVSMKMLKQIPIPKVNENKKHTLISLVDSIISTKKAEPQTDTSALENEIDKQVYHLYGLTYDEVLVVDPGTGITREEYDNNNN